MPKLFVYGTLTIKHVQHQVIGRPIHGRPDTLHDYRKHTRLAYPVALPQRGAHIPGQVLEVSEEELARADAYEGNGYVRVWVTLASGEQAWVYQGNPALYGQRVEDEH